ncbi:DUF1566 domain-containing protein [Leptospira semungkisensis]|uniref:DUF1566 domain-containing protein n=1 Tax=Leptospira semungkisensis TaxID=2484985 RepID=A0A4R9FQH5_9LEPT|nr:DUF1566 domain-containing protein [Leptospira semungkisensis]TGK00831.1 DUF1566 domain-containing protein [Leptospira semungkisensis]
MIFLRVAIFCLLYFLFLGCKTNTDATNSAIFSALSELFASTFHSNTLSVGRSVNLNGSSSPVALGTVVDPSSQGTAVGIALQGSSFPVMLVIYDTSGNPSAVDVNGDGAADYFFCFRQNTTTLRTGLNCSGNSVLIFPGQGYDTNSDGVPDNSILSSIAADVTSPSSVISPSPGIFGGEKTVTVICSDNVAPGDIIYTLDGATPSFSPLSGKVYNPQGTSFTIGAAGDGSYTVKYFCRDLAGNIESAHTAVYQVNHNVPNITFVSALSSTSVSVNSGTINTASLSWQTNQGGTYTVRQNASGCSDGTIIDSGSATANTTIATSINASQLSVGLNSIYICVAAGFTGWISFNLSRDDTAPSLNVSPGAGIYGTSPQNIALSCIDTSSCLIAYTVDGSSPVIDPITGTVTNGTAYSSVPVAITGGTTVIKYVGRDGAGNLSSVNSATYDINSSVPTITVNSVTPVSQSINALVTSTVSITWQTSMSGTYQVLIGGTNCTSGTQASGTNVGGTATAGTPITSTLNNSNFANNSNTVRICVANASLDPQYGNTSITVIKDGIAPTVQSSTPANNSLNVNPGTARVTIVFSEAMDTSLIPSSYASSCSSSVPVNSVYFEADIYDGSSLNCADVTANFTWLTGGTSLQIDMSWLAFPENTKVQVSIPTFALTDVAGNSISSAVQIGFTTASAQKKFQILQSGQAACWDVNGNPIMCGTGSGQGQDGSLQYGTARSYQVVTTSSDSITKDLVTGLVWKTCAMDWEVQSGVCTKQASPVGPWDYYVDNSSSPSVPSSLNACASLNSASYGGINTWRLPSLNEMATITKYGSGSSPALDTSAFKNPTSGQSSSYWVNYWTGTSNFGNPFYSWVTSLSDGSLTLVTKPNSNQVFCVSAANSTATSSSYTVNSSNGIVTDNGTGLIWELCTAGLSGSSCSTGTATTYTWPNALSRCNSLSTAGKTWRLPNVNELRSIIDYSKNNPAIATASFPGTVSSYYWTSTSYAQSPSNAWYVYFANGQLNPFTSKGTSYYVRCVTN